MGVKGPEHTQGGGKVKRRPMLAGTGTDGLYDPPEVVRADELG
jgi:hypothetical protein